MVLFQPMSSRRDLELSEPFGVVVSPSVTIEIIRKADTFIPHATRNAPHFMKKYQRFCKNSI